MTPTYHNKARSMAMICLLRWESISLKTHWVLVVMDQFTRRIIGFGVHKGDVDGTALWRMFNQATIGKGARRVLVQQICGDAAQTESLNYTAFMIASGIQ
jgi:hypothetical protein